jgi:iron transport multicopper oxidase
MHGGETESESQIGPSARASRVLRRFAAALILVLLAALGAAAPAPAEGITYAHDDLRDGWYPEQSSLTPQLVSGGTFGQLWSDKVDGQVYAQPLYDNGNVLVATETNNVYLMDAATGAMRWSQPLNLVGTPYNPLDISCPDLNPTIGVTSTPVIDPTTNTAYLTHKAYASGESGPAKYYMDAVDLSKGTEKPGFPVELSGSAQNEPSIAFEATYQLQRPALLLMNGVVYAAFGSHCDHGTYEGWVFGVSTAGEVKARWADVPAAGDKGGIWMSGSGLVSDGPGRIVFTTGNGTTPTTPAAGSSPPAALSESAVRLAVQPDGSLKAVSFFTPYNAKELSEKDLDFASSGIAALNDEYFGTLSFPHLAVTAGKQGYVYLLNREELGGFQQGLSGGDKVIQKIGPYGGVWSRPGVWPGEGGWIYIPTSYAGGVLRVYKYGVSGSGEPTLSLQGTSSDAFGFGTSAAVITSKGTTAGTALVWILWDFGPTGEGAQLRAYDPVPVGGHPVLRWSAPIGVQSKFVNPGVGGGRIYVGNREGKVMAFGAPVTVLLTGPPTEFPATTIGSSSEKTTTLTAQTSVTVNQLISSNSQFTVGTSSPPLPATLSAGQTIQVPLKFTPTQTGTVAGTLTAETAKGPQYFSMTGTGQSAGPQLQTTPSIIAFGGVTAGSESSSSATFSNIGSAPLKINSEILPSAPFSVSGMPTVGSEIAPGKSVTVTVTFHPTSEGAFHDEFGMQTTGGNGTVPVSGSAGPPGVLKITSERNEFGEVPIGTTATKSFTITNTGGTNVSITKSKPPGGGEFAATTSLAEGTTIAPGETLTETVAFAPTAPGPASGVWLINGNDTTGLHEVTFSGVGTDTFGKTALGASSDRFLQDRKRVNHYALPTAGAVSKLSIYLLRGGVSGQQVLKGLIYADASGAPGALLAVSEQLTYASTNAAGWYALKFSTPVKLAAGKYWIGAITGATGDVVGFRYDSVAGSRDYNTNSYASGPTNPFGSVTTDSEQMSLYATYTPTSTAVPVNTSPPTITGTAQQGRTLTEIHGTWTNEPTSFAYQWLQCDSTGNSCKEIAGAVAQTYVPTSSDVGHTIRVRETASNAGGSGAPARSVPTATIASTPVPVDSSPPTITGTDQQGQTLTEHHGTWTNEPTSFAYQWLQCESTGANCKEIAGAIAQTYVPTSSDVGHTIRVKETASNAGGAGEAATSAATATIAKAPVPENISPPTISGTAQQGQTLTEHHGVWTNEPTSFAYQWLQCNTMGISCLPIAKANAQTYVLTSEDVGYTIAVQETASNASGAGEAATSGPTAVVQSTPATFGKTAVGASSDYFVAERKRVNRYALSAAGTVSKLSIYLTPHSSGQQVLKGLIYADSSGSPTTLLAVSEQLTYASTKGTGWNDLKFSSPVKLAAGNYWIGVMTGATAGVAGFRYDSLSGSRDYNANTYASGPTNPFGSVTTDAEQMSLYATYTTP